MLFGTNILDTSGHQMAIHVPTSSNIRFYTTWRKHNIVSPLVDYIDKLLT